ncbi:MAG: hypothetical protein HYX51_07245 [Chloroflexi bacterium]|nr:hypothetical protein [Chloroflexota bacterium]
MLYVSLFTSDRGRDPELWAVIWNAKAPPTLKLHGAYNLGDNRRVFIWEGETVADLQYMDRFNHVGRLETTPAFDRSAGWRFAFSQNLDGFAQSLVARGAPQAAVERAIDLRRRGVEARGIEAAKRTARAWQAEQAEA